MVEKRGSWYLLTGLVLGGIAGLLFSWMVQPVRYVNTAPSSLANEYKDNYRALIAAAYMANNDLVRAQARLGLLKDANIYQAVAEQAQRSMAQGNLPQEARALGVLAMDLNQALSGAPIGVAYTATAPVPSQTPMSNQPVSSNPLPGESAFSLGTPQGTLTDTMAAGGLAVAPTATAGALFVLKTRQLMCDEDFGAPLIQIIALNAAGQPVPGLEIIINWEGGENHFFTGLKPELGLGYADYSMESDVTYSLKLAEGGKAVTDLAATRCENTEQWGVWRLEFVQP
ncbi:MAG: hypothetical protein JW908_02905 [Anaerolineales bacterium]|nr:hypothetical protein [Anaerolineales bacterium]